MNASDEGAVTARWSARRWVAVGAATALTLALLGFLALRKPAAGAQAAVPHPDVPFQDGKLIRYSDSFARRAGLSTEPARIETLAPVVEVTGTVTYDARTFAAVGARIAGRVSRLHKLVGDRVRAGDVLAELESAELGRAEALVFAARAHEKATEAESKRERRLADARITSERDAEAAEAAYQAGRAERMAAERAVAALGGDLDDRIGILPLRSPVSGRVVSAKPARGQTVEPSDTLFEVADLETVWVMLAVFERDVAAVRAGDPVEISPQTDGARSLKGQVAHVGDVIDLEARTAVVRVEVANHDGRLRPGEAVRAQVQTTAQALRRLTVSRRAVTRIDGKPTVFVALDGATVEARPVTAGPESGDRVAIVDGLRAGDNVVVGGMFALKSELYR